MPSGLTLNNTTGVISVTPSSTQAMMNYTIRAVNSSNQTVTTSLSITVNASGGPSSSTVIYYSIASVPWNTFSIWSLTSLGVPISNGYPGTTENVIIQGGKTKEISGSSVMA